MNYDSYILLNGLKNIKIKLSRTTKIYKKFHTILINTRELKYYDLFLNYKDINKDNYVLKSIEFSKLSEEYLIECIHNKINIPNIDYDNIYIFKKMIYIKNICDINIQKKFNEANIDINNNIYILSKISGKNVNNINDIIKFNDCNYKCITIEIIDPKQNKIKIKI